MKRLLKIGIPSLAAAVVLFAAFHYIRAQGEGPGTVAKTPEALVTPAVIGLPAVAHVLYWTYMTNATPLSGTSESAGLFAIDSPLEFTCHLPCTLEIEQSAQLGYVDYTSNEVDLGALLDGSLTLFPIVGETATDYSYTSFNYTQSFSLKPGTHTVQSYGESSDGVYLGFYHMNYRVYVP
jgi:hypothetical protein